MSSIPCLKCVPVRSNEGLSLVMFQESWGGGVYFGTSTTHWNIGDLILLHSNDATGATLKFISGRYG